MNRKGRPRNIAASVRARLTQRARDRQENVQLALMRYAIERLLYRLGLSSHREEFVLKGAMLFSLWAPTPYRSTGDLDLLGFGDPAPERIVSVFREICLLAAADDGVVFNAETIRAQAARLEEEYSGIRLTLDAEIAGARLPLQDRHRLRRRRHPWRPGHRLPIAARHAFAASARLSAGDRGRGEAPSAGGPWVAQQPDEGLLRSMGHLGDLCLCRIDSRPWPFRRRSSDAQQPFHCKRLLP